MAGKNDEVEPIIVKKIKKGGGGHHGGAWKVAYADFVTAMMAFFLLLWLLNVTTKEQQEGIAEYFDPNPRISTSESGAGGMLGGLTVSPDGAMVDTQQPVTPQTDQSPALIAGSEKPDTQDTEKTKETRDPQEEEQFKEVEEAIEKAMAESDELRALSENLMIDVTPEGLRIQILDQDGEAMFPSGSAEMYAKTRTLLAKVAEIIKKMPNDVSLRGHTDSSPYGSGANYTNWELSSDRANSSRRVLLDAGLPDSKINNVVGKSDKDHLFENAKDARNRRISIILLREGVVVQQGVNRSTEAVKRSAEKDAKPLYQRTDGAVNFP